jgi:two-component system NtrC family sensor kinase
MKLTENSVKCSFKPTLKKMLSNNFRNLITKAKLLMWSPTKLQLQSSLVLVILIISGYAGNYFNLSLFFGVDFLFGSIAVLLVVSFYGIVWGTIAAMIAGAHTYFLWGHPYAAIIFTLEAFLVGWWLRRQRQNILLLDAFYWFFIGIPLVWLFYGQSLGVESQALLLVMLKQAVNGIFNSMIASLILYHSPLHQRLRLMSGKTAKTLSLQHTLFNLFIAFVLFSALTLTVLQGRSALSNIEKNIQQDLQRESIHVAIEMRLWNEQRQRTLQQLAEVAANSEMTALKELQQKTELIQRTFPGFSQLSVVNEEGKEIASYPSLNRKIAEEIDLKELNLKKSLTRTNVAIIRDNNSSWELIQSIPITRNNRFIGSIISESDLSVIQQLLQSFILEEKEELSISLLDYQDRVITSTRSNLKTMQAFDHSQGGEIRRVNAKVNHWLPKIKKPIMIRWKESFYVQKTLASENIPFTIMVEAPTKPHFIYLQDLYIKSIAIVLGITVLAMIFAKIISNWLVQPIWKLAEVTTDVPDKLLEHKAISWPSSWVTEINALLDNFQFMATTLEQKFQEIQTAKEQLEERVFERTWELSQANQELQIEIAERKRVAEALQQSEAQSRAQAQELEQTLYQLKHTQSKLIQTEKMSSLGQLVAGVAHEINNPVSFIFGNVLHAKNYTQDLLELIELYQQEYPNPTAELEEKIEDIDLEFIQEDLPNLFISMQVGSERINEIVKSLRNFSRLDEAEVKAVDIHVGIDSTLMLLKSRLKAPCNGKGGYPEIQVIKEYGNLPIVECYPGQLNQVFMNIFSNAIDALEDVLLHRYATASNVEKLPDCTIESGQENLQVEQFKYSKFDILNLQYASFWIRISTEVIDKDWVEIRIADNGIGINKEIYSKLFDPFFTTKPVGKGTGLGLSISYQIIVEKHGGKLYCISEQGEGTEFIIKIPLLQPNY